MQGKTASEIGSKSAKKRVSESGARATSVRPRAARNGKAQVAAHEPHTNLLSYRDEFPILQRKVYLNSCSLGALSRRSIDAMSRFQELWSDYGASAWYKIWLGELAALREKFAKLIGAQPHEIAIAPNVSSALNGITSALDLGERNRVVMADLDFPTLAYQWLAKQRTGTEVAFAESEDRMTLPADRLIEAIDERTGIVATSRVFYLSGYIQDVAALAQAAHRQGALLVVDDYQGSGQIPLDVKALDIDFLVSGTLKWLMGGPGVAFIYVREELIPKLRPTATGWWGAREMFQFKAGELEYRDDAQRLEAGTPAMAAIYTASAAMDIVLEVGVERVRERTRYLADDLIRRIQERGWKLLCPTDSATRSSIVILGMEQPEELVSALAERGIIVDSRPGRLRISPHFYNSVEENEQIVTALDELLSKRGK